MTGITDTSVFCGCWPFRILGPRSPAEIKAHLQAGGVARAWVAPAEAILAPDPMEANEPLFAGIDGDDFFVPVGVVNVVLGTWRRDAERCIEELGCRALKIFPGYHSYEISDERVDELADLAASRGVPLCVQSVMTDRRAQHPLMMVEPVPADGIAGLAGRHPGARLLACGVFTADLGRLAGAPNVWAEISLVESEQALKKAVDAMGPGRLVFGSHSPYQYLAAMLAKLDVDPRDVAPEAVEAVRGSNAEALLSGE